MPEAMDMAELRRGIERIDLEHTLGELEPDIDQIRAAMDLGRVEDAKAAIADVLRALRAVSESGFPVGAEVDLAELVGFTD
jgi:soluble cytochrome b562